MTNDHHGGLSPTQDSENMTPDELINRGEYFLNMGKWGESEEYFWQAFEDAEEKNHTKACVQALTNIGHIRRKQGDFEEATSLYKDAHSLLPRESDDDQTLMNADEGFHSLLKRLLEADDDEPLMGPIFHGIGSICFVQGYHREAEECFEKSVEISKQPGNERQYADTLDNWGLLCMNQGEHRLSIEKFEKALELHIKTGNRIGRSRTCLNLAGTLIELEVGREPEQRDYSKAYEKIDEGLAIAKEMGNKEGEAIAYSRYGKIHASNNHYDDAIKMFQNTLEIWEQIGYNPGVAMSYSNLAAVYTEKGEAQQASECYKEALRRTEEIGDKHTSADLYVSQAVLYREHLNDWNKAIKQFEKAKAYYDIVGDRQSAEEVAEELNLLNEAV